MGDSGLLGSFERRAGQLNSFFFHRVGRCPVSTSKFGSQVSERLFGGLPKVVPLSRSSACLPHPSPWLGVCVCVKEKVEALIWLQKWPHGCLDEEVDLDVGFGPDVSFQGWWDAS